MYQVQFLKLPQGEYKMFTRFHFQIRKHNHITRLHVSTLARDIEEARHFLCLELEEGEMIVNID